MKALQAQSDTDRTVRNLPAACQRPPPATAKFSSGLIEPPRSVACEKLRGLHPPRTPHVDRSRKGERAPSRGDRSGVHEQGAMDGSGSQRRTGSGRKKGAPDHARIERTSPSAVGASESQRLRYASLAPLSKRTPDDRQPRFTARNGLVCPGHEPSTIEQDTLQRHNDLSQLGKNI